MELNRRLATRAGLHKFLQLSIKALHQPDTTVFKAPWHVVGGTGAKFQLDITHAFHCYDFAARAHKPKEVRLALFYPQHATDRPVRVQLMAKRLHVTCHVVTSDGLGGWDPVLEYAEAPVDGDVLLFQLAFEPADASGPDTPFVKELCRYVREFQLIRSCDLCGLAFSSSESGVCPNCIITGALPDSDGGGDLECAVCYRSLASVHMVSRTTLCCGQGVHTQCLRRCVEATGSCPFCRSPNAI